MTPEPEDLADEIPYAPPLSFANDKDFFLSEDLPLLSDKDKKKVSVRPWKLVANDIIEALEFPSASPIKKSIKWAKQRSIIHITAVILHPQQGTKPTTKSLALTIRFFVYNAVFMVFSNTCDPVFLAICNAVLPNTCNAAFVTTCDAVFATTSLLPVMQSFSLPVIRLSNHL